MHSELGHLSGLNISSILEPNTAAPGPTYVELVRRLAQIHSSLRPAQYSLLRHADPSIRVLVRVCI